MPSREVDELALKIISDTLEQAKDYDLQALQEFFPNMPERDLKDFLIELKDYGFIETSPTFNEFIFIRPKYKLYLHYEDYDYGYSPREDICKVLRELDNQGQINNQQLYNSLEIPIARLNRAVEFIKDNNYAMHSSSFGTGPYTFGGLSSTSATRNYLRNYCKQIGEDNG